MRMNRILNHDSCQGKINFLVRSLFFCCMFVIITNTAHALNFDLGKDVTLDLDTQVKYSSAVRVEDQDEEALANVNNDDGNRAFEQWDFISNRLQLTVDADLKWNNLGAFTRGRAFYDLAYTRSNANNSPETNNSGPLYGGPLTDNQDFTEETEDRHGRDAELLDIFLYGQFDIGERFLDLRVGRQVVSWGESLFFFNSVSTAMAPLDATMAAVPGVELRDLFLPVGQIYSSIDMTENISFSGFYQWEWDPTRLPESGYFFSINQVNDGIDEAGTHLLVGAGPYVTMDRIQDKDPSDSGQFGFAMRYIAEPLNYTEFGLYFINYHEKLPVASVQPGGGTSLLPPPSSMPPDMTNPLVQAYMADTSSYNLEYAEDVKLYGLSAGTAIWDINWGLELSYRQNILASVKSPGLPDGYLTSAEVDVFQVQLSAIANYPQVLMADKWTIMGEIGYNKTYGYGDYVLARGNGDDDALGIAFKITPAWDRVASNLDMELPLNVRINPYNTSTLTGSFTENENSVSLGADFIYRQVYRAGISYVSYFGDPDDNKNTDRDHIGLTLKYTF